MRAIALCLALALAAGERMSSATAADAGKGLARWGIDDDGALRFRRAAVLADDKATADVRNSSADGSADLGFLKVLYGHDAAGFYLFKNGRLHEIKLVPTDPTEIPTILNRIAEQYGAPSLNSRKPDGRCVEDSRACKRWRWRQARPIGGPLRRRTDPTDALLGEMPSLGTGQAAGRTSRLAGCPSHW